jgi:hypothetical protein
MADGHADRLEPNAIRCDEEECWWSVHLDAHRGFQGNSITALNK